MGEVDGIWQAKRVALKAGQIHDGRRPLVEAGDPCKQREHKCPGHPGCVTLVTPVSLVVPGCMRSCVSAMHDWAREPVLLISPHPVDVSVTSLCLY